MEKSEQLLKHLKEGKDVYDAVVPKLNKLERRIVYYVWAITK